MTEDELVVYLMDQVLEAGRLYEAGRVRQAWFPIFYAWATVKGWLTDERGVSCSLLVDICDDTTRAERSMLDYVGRLGRAVRDRDFMETMVLLNDLGGALFREAEAQEGFPHRAMAEEEPF